MIDTTARRSLTRLLDPLRTTPLMLDQQVIISAQIAAWVHASFQVDFPIDLTPGQQLATGKDVARIFRALRQREVLGLNSDAFIAEDSLLEAIPDAMLARLIYEARALLANGFLDEKFADEVLDTLSALSGRSSIQFTLPRELVQLLTGLAALQHGTEVYTPFDESVQFSLAAAKEGAQVFTEVQHYSPLPYLINLLSGEAIGIQVGSPLAHPSYTDGAKLRTFATAISFPPIGMRVPAEIADHDLYGRFPEKSTSSTVLSIRHVLAQTAERMVLLVPNNLLFGRGAERSIRQDLVHEGLEAVISLPPALLFGTTIPLAVLVINRTQPRATHGIRFVDGNAPRFHKRDGKGRTTLTGWRELLQTATNGEENDHVFIAQPNQIADNDYQLMVSWYVRSEIHDAVDEALRQGVVRPLEDLVEFIRPAPISTAATDDDLTNDVAEVGMVDIQDFGYIRRPQKQLSVPTLKGALRPLDILICMKGSVGRVGIVPPGQDQNWVAGQSFLALRVNQDHSDRPLYSPQALFLYLRSAVGQACLQRITSGAAVPLIQLRELRKLPVLVATAEQQAQAEHTLQQVVTLQTQIDDLRAEQTRLSGTFWSLPTRSEA